MSDNVFTLHKTPAQHNIIEGLRNLADTLEQEGPQAYGMPVITTIALVLGHSTVDNLDNGELQHETWCELFSWGPRNDALTIRGLLSTAIVKR